MMMMMMVLGDDDDDDIENLVSLVCQELSISFPAYITEEKQRIV